MMFTGLMLSVNCLRKSSRVLTAVNAFHWEAGLESLAKASLKNASGGFEDLNWVFNLSNSFYKYMFKMEEGINKTVIR